jgi:hypothetical protein
MARPFDVESVAATFSPFRQTTVSAMAPSKISETSRPSNASFQASTF